MRILVIGGTRFIGPPAVKRLAAIGHDLTIFHRGRHQAEIPRSVRRIYGERDRLAEHKADFEKLAPDVVIAMGAGTQADGERLVEVFADLAKRLVVISSCDVYRAYDRFRKADTGKPDKAPLTEDSPLRDKLYPYRTADTGPETFAYHYDKILMERAAQAEPEKLPCTVLRLPMVYGPGDYQHRLYPYLRRMADGRRVILMPEDMAGWHGLRAYVEDIAEAIGLCATSDAAAGRTYHVSEEPESELSWVKRAASAMRWRGEIVLVPNAKMPAHLAHHYDPRQNWSLNSARIRAELGYAEPATPVERMRRTCAWEKENPPEAVEPGTFDYAAEDRVLANLK